MEGVKELHTEYPVDIPELNVKGFIDIVVIMETEKFSYMTSRQ